MVMVLLVSIFLYQFNFFFFTNLFSKVWLTKQRMLPGPVFGSVDRFDGLGIFFDTYDNERSHVRKSKSAKERRKLKGNSS